MHETLFAVPARTLLSRISLHGIAHDAPEQKPSDRHQGRLERKTMLTNVTGQGLRLHVASDAGQLGTVLPGIQFSIHYGKVNTGSRCLHVGTDDLSQIGVGIVKTVVPFCFKVAGLSWPQW